MSQIRLFCILSLNCKVYTTVTADEYFEVREKCKKVCSDCDEFERKEN